MTTTRTFNPPEIVISKNGNQLVKKPNGYYAVYVTKGKRALANLQTTNFALAEQRRDLLFADWLEQGAKYREPKTPQQKVLDKPNRYIYYRDPWIVRVGKKMVGTTTTKKEAQALLDNFLKQ